MDAGGNVMADADVALTTQEGASASRTMKTDSAGRFSFSGVAAGRYRVTASAMGLTPASVLVEVNAGEMRVAPTLHLGAAKVETEVQVTASGEDLADAELEVEEHQRLAGIMPNFFVSYDWHAAALSPKQKLRLSMRSVMDPATFLITGAVTGVQQATGQFSGFGPGAGGYGKRYAANTGDVLFGTLLGGAVYPILFHQDPRYFYKGTGTTWTRLRYALSTAVICRGDNGKLQPNYSGILGDLSTGALSNLYYPAANRNGAALTFENGLLDILNDGLGNVVQEFLLKHLTPHAPSYGQGTGAVAPHP